jgi:glutamyl-tRNA synthetase
LGWTLDEPERACLFAIAPHIQERTKLMTEVPEQVGFLLVDDIAYEETSWRKVMAKDGVREVLDAAATTLADLEQWDTASIDAALRSMLAERELSARKGLQPIRVAISGSTVSPPLFESLEVLGRETTLARLATARSLLGDRI